MLVLFAHGVKVYEVADALGVQGPSVSRWLRGKVPAPDGLYDAIAELAGRDAADEVERLVAEARAARVEAVPA